MRQTDYNGLVPVPQSSLQVSSLSNNCLKLSLVLPTYNEGKNIQDLIRILTNLLDPVIPGRYELIVVDDNSPDNTWKLALELVENYPQLRVMRRTGERGLSTAVIRGWQIAEGEILGVIDADLQHPPFVLLKLLQEIEFGADLAVASRHVEGGGVSEWSLSRRILSRGAQTLGLLILPEVIGRLSDPMSGYFMVRRSAIAQKTMAPLGYKILIEVTARGNINKIAEVGYIFQERQAGESKVTWKQYLQYLQHLYKLRISLSSRFLRFCVVGIGGVFVDMTALYLLSDPQGLNLSLALSKMIASELGIAHNFLWNDSWTFRDLAHSQPGKLQKLKRFLKFNFVCLTGLIISVLVLSLLYERLGFQYLPAGKYIANLIAIGVVTFWNFWLHSKISWRVTRIK